MLLPAALAILVVALTPPLSVQASRYAVFQALQFSLLAIVVPCLASIGAPWRLLGLGSVFERLQKRREGRHRLRHAALVVVPALVLEVLWRSSPLVTRLAEHRWLVFVEAATLVPAGTAVWAELVPSPPLKPRLAVHLRVFVTAVSMWTIWILAYVTGLANSDTYRVFAAVSNRAISVSADQQFTAGVMWAVAALAFVPVAFVNLMAWLRRN